jgi:hypothetical protein
VIEMSHPVSDLEEPTHIETRLLSPDVAIPKLSILSRCRCNVEMQSMNRCGRFSYFYVPHCLRLAEKRQNANALASGLEERDQYKWR